MVTAGINVGRSCRWRLAQEVDTGGLEGLAREPQGDTVVETEVDGTGNTERRRWLGWPAVVCGDGSQEVGLR